MTADGIDPADLECCLRVLREAEGLPVEHPDAVAVRRATAGLFKTVKDRRRAERRAAALAADAAATADSADWLHRLTIVGIDLRDPARVAALADAVAAEGPLDILINNACQTVRRSAAGYALLARAEAAPLPSGRLPAIRVFGPEDG